VRVLQPDNTSFNMVTLADQDLRFCVLDYTNPADVDFYFVPLVFLDVFSRPSADLQIGPYRIQMPLDWSIVIGDKNLGMLEVIELKQLNARDFEAFAFNPIRGFAPEFHQIDIVNVFPDVAWTMPKLRSGHLLPIPLHEGPNPPCVMFVRETNRLPDSLDISKIFS